MMGYGYFDDAAREYVITRPDTPTPWFNYIGEGRYGGIVSNAAGGYAFDRDPKNRRVSRYRYNAIPADQPGRYVYLRDMESGKFWSPTWHRPRGGCKVRVPPRAGYTGSPGGGIAASLLYFVPPRPPTRPPLRAVGAGHRRRGRKLRPSPTSNSASATRWATSSI
jgi:cellobiose phosphorylase